MTGVSTWDGEGLFSFGIVIARLAGLIVFLPGIGDPVVPGRIKALLCIVMGIAITPVIGGNFPVFKTPLQAGLVLMGEILAGYFLAMLVRLVVCALDVVGALAGYQIGLANIFVQNLASSLQTGLTSAFFGAFAVLFLFLTDLHYLFLKVLVESYDLIRPDPASWQGFTFRDFPDLFIDVMGKSFLLALQLSFPILIVSLMITMVGALANRLIPQLQVFFMLQPFQILAGLVVISLMLEISMGMMCSSLENIFKDFWLGEFHHE